MKIRKNQIKKTFEITPLYNKAFSGQALAFISGFVFANARLAGGISPFAPAFAASVQGNRSLAATVGGCCGCLLSLEGTYSARLIALILCTGLINFCLYKTGSVRNNRIAAPVSSAGSCLLTGLAVLTAQGFSADGIITYMSETVISGGCACFLSRLSFPSGFFSRKSRPDNAQLSGITVFLCMLVVSALPLAIGEIRLAHIAAIVIIMLCAKLTGISGGCIGGGSMGFAVCLGSASPVLGGICTFGGLVAGLLSKKGRAIQCLGFSTVCAVAIFTSENIFQLVPVIYETVIALVIFAAIPKRFFEVNAVFFSADNTVPEYEAMRKALLSKLEAVSGGLDEISLAVDRIAAEMVKIEKSEENSAYDIIKQLVRDQFSTLSTAVREIAHSFSDETKFDTPASARVSSVLSGYGINAKEVICSQTGEQTKIDIKAEKITGKISRTALMDDIENACGYKLSIPDVTEDEAETLIRFEKRPRYNLRIGHAQRTAEGKMCGDSFDSFSDTEGNTVIIISDGMGTGPKAAVDGTVAAWLFSKLIAAGLGFESALKLSNSAMIVKSAEESLATIDSVRISLHTGKADFFKAGAGTSFVCKGKKIYNIGSPSLPLGILREVEFSKDTLMLRRGDKLLMMSDGVPQAAYNEIARSLSNFNKNDPSELAERVVEVAEKYSVLKRPDDITAVAVIVG